MQNLARSLTSAAFLVLLACGGGVSSLGGRENDAGGDAGGTGGTGGSTAQGDSGANAGSGGTGGVNNLWCEGGPPPGGCTRSCTDGNGSASVVFCHDGMWTCSDGWVVRDWCPDNSCAKAKPYCCDDLGRLSSPACTNGVREPCPTGAMPTAQRVCIPKGLTDCNGLVGNACPVEGAECNPGGFCVTTYKCEKEGTELKWRGIPPPPC